ncbi:hypothetical protein NDU88_004717 [Pleurodeles waltl]|uniref:Uncharacterized protein n=1 Tax=Pleurodeles waltl TaxID=8319 RepID=A0AAV7MU87_PLEWA|nr:hypothetical protein NDU88_004717 [Pleurodeles waltl]
MRLPRPATWFFCVVCGRGGGPEGLQPWHTAQAVPAASSVPAAKLCDPAFKHCVRGRASPASAGRLSPPGRPVPRPRTRTRPVRSQSRLFSYTPPRSPSATSRGTNFRGGLPGRNATPRPQYAVGSTLGSLGSLSLPGSDSSCWGAARPPLTPIKANYLDAPQSSRSSRLPCLMAWPRPRAPFLS